jgi:hypothetical protein
MRDAFSILASLAMLGMAWLLERFSQALRAWVSRTFALAPRLWGGMAIDLLFMAGILLLFWAIVVHWRPSRWVGIALLAAGSILAIYLSLLSSLPDALVQALWSVTRPLGQFLMRYGGPSSFISLTTSALLLIGLAAFLRVGLDSEAGGPV